jgi:regulator of RNase E activity RraA
MGFQYLLTGVTAGHGPLGILGVNVPVSVGGMDVAPGEIIHMDENGAVKFPAARAEQVLQRVKALQEQESVRMAALRGARSAAEVRAVFAGKSYGAKG